MKVIVVGASGMLGQGVLRECLLDPEVERVLVVGRRALDTFPPGVPRDKLTEAITPDLTDLAPIEAQLRGYDACFFCLGATSSGLTEDAYRKITYDITVAFGRALASPTFTFVFVSGAGTDSTERGRTMWARVKGAAENALLAMPFKGAYMFRPAVIQPRHGTVSRTRSYRLMYTLLRPLVWLLARSQRLATTTERIGRAMLAAAKHGAPTKILGTREINQLGS